jgi:hypothetical protein
MLASMQQHLLRGLQGAMGTGEETQRLRDLSTRAGSQADVGAAPVVKGKSGKVGAAAGLRLAQLRQRHRAEQEQEQEQEAQAYQQLGAHASKQLSLQQQLLARVGVWQGQLLGQKAPPAPAASAQVRPGRDAWENGDGQGQQQAARGPIPGPLPGVGAGIPGHLVEAGGGGPVELAPLEHWAEQAVSAPEGGQQQEGVGPRRGRAGA